MWRLLWTVPLLAAVSAGLPVPVEAQETLHRVRVKRGASIPVLHRHPADKAADAVILLAGGDGRIGDLAELGQGNFLVRSRQYFAADGFRVLVPGVPSDRPEGLKGRRIEPWHGADILALVDWARLLGSRRVWLVGTSRGTIGAVNAASTGHPNLAGIVLTASLLREGRRVRGSVFRLPLRRIHVPVLIIHHRRDACIATPPSQVQRLAQALTTANPVSVYMVSGGTALGPRAQRRRRFPECSP